MTSLPTHRQLLTSLITSLSSISPSLPSEAPPSPPTSTSPLHALSQSHRQLLLTLHVLFPNLLLPAFDLLDRGLVTRLTLSVKDHESGSRPDAAERKEDVTAGRPNDSAESSPGFFLVKSLATTLTRRHRDVGLSSQRYLVQLRTWQCACASFTFDAFPSSSGSAGDHENESTTSELDESLLNWSFGGMSLDGLGASGGDVPCCKHLLACLIEEKWPSLLRQYLDERTVSREEMAGIMADM